MHLRTIFRSVASVTVLIAGALGQTISISFRPVDAEYSTALDRIVMVSASPNQLHIYNPAAKADVTVNLAAAPNAVSVSPDGLFAAVGHLNLVSYVNLSTASVVKTFTVSLNVNDLVLGPGYIYLPPTMSIQISNGSIVGASTARVARERFSASDQAVYYTDANSSYYVSRSSIATGVLTDPTSSSYSGFYCTGDVWLYLGAVFNSCGQGVLATRDFPYFAKLPGIRALIAMAPNDTNGLAVIPGNDVDYNFSPPVTPTIRFFYSKAGNRSHWAA